MADPTDPDLPSVHRALTEVKPEHLSFRAWTKAAGVNPSFFGDLARRGGTTRQDTLDKLLVAVEVSRERFAEVLTAVERGLPTPAADPTAQALEPPSPRQLRMPRDVPILGTAEGAVRELNGSGELDPMSIDQSEVVDYLLRPPGVQGKRDVYALYVTGSSMEPRFGPGDPVYVDPKRAPSIMDDVIVQLAGSDADEPVVTLALIKRLVRRSSTWIELEQFSPPRTFRLELKHVARVHRVVPVRELFGH